MLACTCRFFNPFLLDCSIFDLDSDGIKHVQRLDRNYESEKKEVLWKSRSPLSQAEHLVFSC